MIRIAPATGATFAYRRGFRFSPRTRATRPYRHRNRPRPRARAPRTCTRTRTRVTRARRAGATRERATWARDARERTTRERARRRRVFAFVSFGVFRVFRFAGRRRQVCRRANWLRACSQLARADLAPRRGARRVEALGASRRSARRGARRVEVLGASRCSGATTKPRAPLDRGWKRFGGLASERRHALGYPPS
jgi:hypothetical protein